MEWLRKYGLKINAITIKNDNQVKIQECIYRIMLSKRKRDHMVYRSKTKQYKTEYICRNKKLKKTKINVAGCISVMRLQVHFNFCALFF